MTVSLVSHTPRPPRRRFPSSVAVFHELLSRRPWRATCLLHANLATLGGGGSDGCARCFGTNDRPSRWSSLRPCITAVMQGLGRTWAYGHRRQRAQVRVRAALCVTATDDSTSRGAVLSGLGLSFLRGSRTLGNLESSHIELSISSSRTYFSTLPLSQYGARSR